MSTPSFYIGGTYLRVSGSERNPTYQQVKLLAVDPDDGALLYGEVIGEDGDFTVVTIERSELCYAVPGDVLTNILALASEAQAPVDVLIDKYTTLEAVSHVRFVPSAPGEYASRVESRSGYMPK